MDQTGKEPTPPPAPSNSSEPASFGTLKPKIVPAPTPPFMQAQTPRSEATPSQLDATPTPLTNPGEPASLVTPSFGVPNPIETPAPSSFPTPPEPVAPHPFPPVAEPNPTPEPERAPDEPFIPAPLGGQTPVSEPAPVEGVVPHPEPTPQVTIPTVEQPVSEPYVNPMAGVLDPMGNFNTTPPASLDELSKGPNLFDRMRAQGTNQQAGQPQEAPAPKKSLWDRIRGK